MKRVIFGCVALLASSIHAATIGQVEQRTNGAGAYYLLFKGAAAYQPSEYTSNDPKMIVLDFKGVTVDQAAKQIPVASTGIYGVDFVAKPDGARAVINLATQMRYSIGVQDQDVVVALDGSALQAQAPKATPAAQAPQARGLNPTFKSTRDNTGIFTFNVPSSKHSVVDVQKQGSSVVIDISNYTANKDELKRLMVSEYKTPVTAIDINRTQKGSKITVDMGKNPFEFSVYQSDDTYTLEVKKPDQVNLDKMKNQIDGFTETRQYRGEPLTLNFQDIEVRAVLQIIAEFTGNNFVVSDTVTGNITLRLVNVPWDKALDIILKTKNLGKRVNDNVYYIAPAQELDKSEIDALIAIREKSQNTPTQTVMIQVNYAKADDLKAILEKSRVGEYSTAGNSLAVQDSILSSRGRVTTDPRTNMLLVSDIPEKLRDIEELIAKLDEPVRQVLVDARIVRTTDSFDRSFGLRFSNTSYNNEVYTRGSVPTLSSVSGAVGSATPAATTAAASQLQSRLGVNVGSVSDNTQLGLSILSGDFNINMELTAMQNEGEAEVISSPRVVTQDGVQAKVAAGLQIPTFVRSDSGTTVNYKDVVLSLDVTPRITPNYMVNMELRVTNDAIAEKMVYEGGDTFSISTNQLETSVLVDSGETIVLGGFYRQTQTATDKKVPVLGDIPLLGEAFKQRDREFTKDELLVFVTPRIIDKRINQVDKFSNLRQ
ncbi:MAG: type IV pilus secretin PilQ [Cardiobacteriaceae bacterium]|nr:type IV pilus secretin PilQ [Cardiobacteriaceae bacterium]